VRPLSESILPPTEAEKKGWVDREKMLRFSGRSRAPQLDLARKYQIDGFLCGGSGCRLTDEKYADKLRDLITHKKRASMEDIKLLCYGRHFRIGKNKIVVGRSEEENNSILRLKNESDIIFEAKGAVGPITILQGKVSKEAVAGAAGLTARYSDAKDESVTVAYGNPELNKEITVKKLSEEEISKIRIS
jgi:tRNA-uridine 2-sulfurtransferase